MIIDLTASQFGMDPVIVATVDDKRFRSTMTSADRVEATKAVKDRCRLWLAHWHVQHADNQIVDCKRLAPTSRKF